MTRGAYLVNLGVVPYGEAFELQRSLAGAVSQGAIPETVVFLEHPPVVTIGRRTETESELHIPDDASVDRRDRSRGKVDFHGPGQLARYPILDLRKHGKTWRTRDLEVELFRTLAAFELEGVRYEGLTGVGCRRREGRGRARSRPSACTSPVGSRRTGTH
jgi:lipoyl(octanoyl) transferase